MHRLTRLRITRLRITRLWLTMLRLTRLRLKLTRLRLNFDVILLSFLDADDITSQDVRLAISNARASYTNALYRYMVKKRGPEEAADRFGQLLLLGPAIATMAVEMKEAVVVADFFEQIIFSPFAKELLLGVFHVEPEDDTVSTTTNTVPQVVEPQPLPVAVTSQNNYMNLNGNLNMGLDQMLFSQNGLAQLQNPGLQQNVSSVLNNGFGNGLLYHVPKFD